MRFASSLTNRVFLACTLLAMLSLGCAFYFVNERATAAVEADLRRGLVDAASLVDQHHVTRTDHFTRLARLVADLPRLKAAVETGDGPTVQPLADQYSREMNADLLVLTGRDEAILGSAGGDADAVPALLRSVRSPDEMSTFSPHGRGILQLVSVPIRLDGAVRETLGRLTVGFFLDDRLAAEFKAVTGSEIAFGAGGRILASTFPAEARPALSPMIHTSEVESVALDDQEYVLLARPLLTGSTGSVETPVALVLRSRTERLQFLNTIRAGLAGVLVVMLLLATLLSYAVARTMTRPLATITHAMRDVAATGDLTRRVTLKSRAWDDEDARLLASTFNTLTESIARFQREAAQKDRLSSLGRLSTVIAHEIRNPLMIIRASLAALRADRCSPSELREAVADIDEETTRINRIISEVLDFVRPIRFDFAEADLYQVCRASAEAAWAGDASPVVFDFEGSALRFVTDAERLRTALVNVLTNARHAVRGGSRVEAGTSRGALAVAVAAPPAVVLRTRVSGDRVVIAVEDRGPGIAPADLAHILDPFFTTRRAGTGLGLPIARNIVEGLGGTLSVSSRLGEGTEIRIDLPLRSEATAT